MSFSYFIELAKRPTATDLAEAFPHARKLKSIQTQRGPAGRSGWLLYSSDEPPPITDTCLEMGQGSGRWVIMDGKPSPGELQRPEMLEGSSVEMADGTAWQPAYARRFALLDDRITVYCPLPNGLQLDRYDGRWKPTGVAARLRPLADLAEAYQTALVEAAAAAPENATSFRFEFAHLDDLAIAGLTANYYISKWELALLDCYDLEARQRLIDAITDRATLTAWHQKKTLDAALDGFVSNAGQNK